MLTSTQPQARTRTIPGGNSQVAGTIAQLRRQAGTSEASAAFVLSLINTSSEEKMMILLMMQYDQMNRSNPPNVVAETIPNSGSEDL
ncbi:hypothetical protein PCASD_02145 [Puccinia coronata f. sp. avenae]|uniref:Uncharacterized protein n=1 Tax=Puccinia coronata f. sp. avenae TaxID=200324 RepID=A0A2N5VPZ9_9BASI|nr:hypothetical protein PCASD_02145 [Puccinia coronata f. sp. avenae]